MKENLFEAYARMCEFYNNYNNGYCRADCKIGKILKEKRCQYIYPACVDFFKSNPKEAEEIITKWAKEHPIKTRQDVFLELHPNAALDEDGVLNIHTCSIDNRTICYTGRKCEECKKEYWGGAAE